MYKIKIYRRLALIRHHGVGEQTNDHTHNCIQAQWALIPGPLGFENMPPKSNCKIYIHVGLG